MSLSVLVVSNWEENEGIEVWPTVRHTHTSSHTQHTTYMHTLMHPTTPPHTPCQSLLRRQHLMTAGVAGVPLRALRVPSGHVNGQSHAERVQLGLGKLRHLRSPQQPPPGLPPRLQRPRQRPPHARRRTRRLLLQPAAPRCAWRHVQRLLWGRRGLLRGRGWGRGGDGSGGPSPPPPLQRQQQRQQQQQPDGAALATPLRHGRVRPPGVPAGCARSRSHGHSVVPGHRSGTSWGGGGGALLSGRRTGDWLGNDVTGVKKFWDGGKIGNTFKGGTAKTKKREAWSGREFLDSSEIRLLGVNSEGLLNHCFFLFFSLLFYILFFILYFKQIFVIFFFFFSQHLFVWTYYTHLQNCLYCCIYLQKGFIYSTKL